MIFNLFYQVWSAPRSSWGWAWLPSVGEIWNYRYFSHTARESEVHIHIFPMVSGNQRCAHFPLLLENQRYYFSKTARKAEISIFTHNPGNIMFSDSSKLPTSRWYTDITPIYCLRTRGIHISPMLPENQRYSYYPYATREPEVFILALCYQRTRGIRISPTWPGKRRLTYCRIIPGIRDVILPSSWKRGTQVLTFSPILVYIAREAEYW